MKRRRTVPQRPDFIEPAVVSRYSLILCTRLSTTVDLMMFVDVKQPASFSRRAFSSPFEAEIDLRHGGFARLSVEGMSPRTWATTHLRQSSRVAGITDNAHNSIHCIH